MKYHIQINGGWRLVETIRGQHGSLVAGATYCEFAFVRDLHSNEYLLVPFRDLVPVVPREQWEAE